METKGVLKLFSVLLVGLFLISLFSGVVKAQGTGDTSDTSSKWSLSSEMIKQDWLKEGGSLYFITQFVAAWESGDEGFLNGFLKYFFLALLIFFLYSVLSGVGFFKNRIMAVILSVIVGFLITWGINQTDLLAIMNSYTTLGVVLLLGLPIILLGFVTLFVIKEANPMGIFIQRILWLAYGGYLFIRTGLSFFIQL